MRIKTEDNMAVADNLVLSQEDHFIV